MRTKIYGTTKRLIDIAGAAMFLVLSAPLMLVMALAVRWSIGRPVLFRQVRPGWLAEPFECLKFRTMTDARDEQGELLGDDQRLTRLGEFLRRYSLDELPQFWCVLRGDMSLVGPRPLMVRYLPRYTAEQSRRHLVKPGITGWAQINGRNAIDWERKLDLDIWYVDHCSFGLDLKILAITFWKVLSAHGISQSGYTTMPEFWGIATGRESGSESARQGAPREVASANA